MFDTQILCLNFEMKMKWNEMNNITLMETPITVFHLFFMTWGNLPKDISICVYDFLRDKPETENIKKSPFLSWQ